MPRNSIEKVREATYLANVRRTAPEVPFELIRQAGGLLIGTARTKQRHRPHPHHMIDNGELRPLVLKPDRTVARVLLATDNPILAMLGAVAGDINVPGQRQHLGENITNTNAPFSLASLEWDQSEKVALVPPCVQEVAKQRAYDTVGCIDVVWKHTPNGQFAPLIGGKKVGDFTIQDGVKRPSEYAVAASRVRVGSLPVFGNDILELISQGALEVVDQQR